MGLLPQQLQMQIESQQHQQQQHDSASTDGYDAAVTTAAAVDVFKCL